MLTDTHCHLYYNKFDEDRDEMIRRAVDAGVGRMLVPGITLETSRQAIQLAEKYEQIYAAVGVHPTDVGSINQGELEEIANLASHEKVVAIGEVGLDYYWVKDEEKQAAQRNALEEQIKIASEVKKPLVIHIRERDDATTGPVFDALLDIMEEWIVNWKKENHLLASKPGVLHSFNGDLNLSSRALELGFFLGVTGPVTYQKNEDHRAMLAEVPLDRLLIETDSPFLTPVPHRGKRNEPAFVSHIADKIAEIHMTTREQVALRTSANAHDLFGWGG